MSTVSDNSLCSACTDYSEYIRNKTARYREGSAPRPTCFRCRCQTESVHDSNTASNNPQPLQVPSDDWIVQNVSESQFKQSSEMASHRGETRSRSSVRYGTVEGSSGTGSHNVEYEFSSYYDTETSSSSVQTVRLPNNTGQPTVFEELHKRSSHRSWHLQQWIDSKAPEKRVQRGLGSPRVYPVSESGSTILTMTTTEDGGPDWDEGSEYGSDESTEMDIEHVPGQSFFQATLTRPITEEERRMQGRHIDFQLRPST